MRKKEEIVGLIPVREGSKRVPGKNFIEFADGMSLLEIKIKHLKGSGCFSHIYISSDSKQAEKIARDNGVEFLARDPKMCREGIQWSEAVRHIMDTIPGNPIVTWALTTSPLFGNFEACAKKFLEGRSKYDSLVAVLPKKSFFLDKNGRGINYNPGYWHPYSQQLETYYEVTGACYMGLKSDMHKWSYWFGPNPYLFEVSPLEAIDVDTKEDFKFAQKLYKAEKK